MTISLSDLPNEILHRILLFVPPTLVARVQRVSHHFNDLPQPVLWQHYCHAYFKYWSPGHCILEKFSAPVADVNWKDLFSFRHKLDRAIDHEIDSILQVQTHRIEKTERIVVNGYDAKDSLLRHIDVDDDADDVLARRFVSAIIQVGRAGSTDTCT